MSRYFALILLSVLLTTCQVPAATNGTPEKTTYLPVVNAPAPHRWWQPPPETTWQWQLDGELDLSFDVEMYDIDLFETDTTTVATLHAEGRAVVCYLNAGAWEAWRPDADRFPAEVLGNAYEGWPGERWLDIRRLDLLAPIMQARLDLCRDKGFDAVEPDNIDGYTNETGFPLTYADQIAYNRWLATEAHARGLSIGLKNDPEQVIDLLDDFDWALVESCFAQEWCEMVSPFIAQGKAVFAAEYTDTGVSLDEICPQAERLRFSVILKHRNLDAYRDTCP